MKSGFNGRSSSRHGASRSRRTSVHPGKVGRVSQRTKAAQAHRDARGYA